MSRLCRAATAERGGGSGATGGPTTTRVQDVTIRRPLFQFANGPGTGQGRAYYIADDRAWCARAVDLKRRQG